MKVLHNQKSREQLEKELSQETFARKALSFYRYFQITDPQEFRDDLYKAWFPLKVFGRIYVAQEGINAQLSVPEPKWNEFVKITKSFSDLQSIFFNEALTEGKKAFWKLDLRVREKIVADGLDGNIFESYSRGHHLSPKEFHEKLSDPNVLVIDTRNDYECQTGRFENALCPESETFGEVLPELGEKLKEKKDKDILMYCTGGIRCEKASAYFKSQGFENVFQLQGGIINYIRTVEKENIPSKYVGNLFVFDGRMAEKTVGQTISHCEQCSDPYDVHRDCNNIPCHKMMIQCPSCEEKLLGCCSENCKTELMKKTQS